MAAQVRQAEERMGALEVGLAAQIEDSVAKLNADAERLWRTVSAIRFQHSYAEANGRSDSAEASDGEDT